MLSHSNIHRTSFQDTSGRSFRERYKFTNNNFSLTTTRHDKKKVCVVFLLKFTIQDKLTVLYCSSKVITYHFK